MNWWWVAAGWIACGGLASWIASSAFYKTWWYVRPALFVAGPFGLGFVVYVLFAMAQSGDR